MKSFDLLLIVGILIIAASAYFLVEGGSLTTRRNVLDVGGLTVSAEERHTVAPWMAGLGLVLGTSILIVRATRKT